MIGLLTCRIENVSDPCQGVLRVLQGGPGELRVRVECLPAVHRPVSMSHLNGLAYLRATTSPLYQIHSTRRRYGRLRMVHHGGRRPPQRGWKVNVSTLTIQSGRQAVIASQSAVSKARIATTGARRRTDCTAHRNHRNHRHHRHHCHRRCRQHHDDHAPDRRRRQDQDHGHMERVAMRKINNSTRVTVDIEGEKENKIKRA